MATEELLLVINDAQLKQALTQINIIKSAQTKTVGQVTGLTSLIAQTRRDARAAGINLDDLPTLNRDMRIIGGLLPGFREASRIFFQARRGVRAAQMRREAEALRAIDPELARQLGMGATIGQLALLVVIVTTIMRLVNQSKLDIEQNRGEYERLFREGLNISHEEYKQLEASQIGYATRFDELEAKWMSGEQLEAIAEYVRSYMLTPWLAPKGIHYDPLQPTVLSPEYVFFERNQAWLKEAFDRWWENVSGDRRPPWIPPGAERPPTPDWMIEMGEWWKNLPKDRPPGVPETPTPDWMIEMGEWWKNVSGSIDALFPSAENDYEIVLGQFNPP